jgi:hypothetical protein
MRDCGPPKCQTPHRRGTSPTGYRAFQARVGTFSCASRDQDRHGSTRHRRRANSSRWIETFSYLNLRKPEWRCALWLQLAAGKSASGTSWSMVSSWAGRSVPTQGQPALLARGEFIRVPYETIFRPDETDVKQRSVTVATKNGARSCAPGPDPA